MCYKSMFFITEDTGGKKTDTFIIFARAYRGRKKGKGTHTKNSRRKNKKKTEKTEGKLAKLAKLAALPHPLKNKTTIKTRTKSKTINK